MDSYYRDTIIETETLDVEGKLSWRVKTAKPTNNVFNSRTYLRKSVWLAYKKCKHNAAGASGHKDIYTSLVANYRADLPRLKSIFFFKYKLSIKLIKSKYLLKCR